MVERNGLRVEHRVFKKYHPYSILLMVYMDRREVNDKFRLNFVSDGPFLPFLYPLSC
jgi:uncharacterized protein (DUF952 family)